MNAGKAYETALWKSIPIEIRDSISDSATHGHFNTSYYIRIGTLMWWADRDIIRNTLTKLGYETELIPQAVDDNGDTTEYELKICWEHPRKITYWD